jgi:hypothetical protein
MDRVDLVWQFGTDRQRRWRQGGISEWNTTSVQFGRLADGRWFADRSGYLADTEDRQKGACVFSADERGRTLALRLAYRWMSEGEWRPQPASFDGSGQPTDGLPWRRSGGQWFLDGASDPPSGSR